MKRDEKVLIKICLKVQIKYIQKNFYLKQNDSQKLRKTFIKLYNETCYPLLFHSLIPGLNLHNQEEAEVNLIIQL